MATDNVVFYARTSCDGDSLDDQFAGLKSALSVGAQRLSIVGRYGDHVSVGRGHDRPGLRKVMDDIESGKIFPNAIAVECADRLSRDQASIKAIVERFRLHGVKVVSAETGFTEVTHW